MERFKIHVGITRKGYKHVSNRQLTRGRSAPLHAFSVRAQDNGGRDKESTLLPQHRRPGEVGLRKLLPFLPALWRSPVPPPGPSSYPQSHPSPSLAPGPPGGIHTSPLSFCTSHFLLELQAGSLRRLHRNRWPTDLSAAEPNDAVPRAAPTTPRGSCHRPLSHLQLPPPPPRAAATRPRPPLPLSRVRSSRPGL